MKMWGAIIVSLCLWAAPVALAQTHALTAEAALNAGQYDVAIKIAEADGTANSLVLASSALIAKALTLESKDIKDDAERARSLAARAMVLDPDNAEAYLQFAVSEGVITRNSGAFTVWRNKLAQKTLAAMEDAKSRMPNDPRVDALYGAWHFGIVRKAGEDRGQKMFGANTEDGLAAFEAAVTKAPNDIVIAVNFALAMLTVDSVKYGPRAKELLVSAQSMPARTRLDQVYQWWAKTLLDVYDDPDALKSRAEYYSDGGE